MMSVLFRENGEALRIDILKEPEVEQFIHTHANILDSAFAKTEMSDTMRENLQRSDYIFSGFKTFHELGEAFPSLLDEKGHKKPFNQFLNDVQKIDQTYNKRYLQAEYNFASASSDMAGRWEQFVKDEEEYYLQYRTANDGAVRPEHAALHDVTLPASDSFWDSYYPPNGWNCRCTVVQVLRNMHEATPHDEAMKRGSQALAKDKKGMFNFNPGKQQKTFPPKHPYFKAPEKVLKVVEWLEGKVEDIEKSLEQFCEKRAIDKTFKGKVSLSGISIENAREIAKAFDSVYGYVKTGKLAGIRTVDPASATGKRVFRSGENAIACYDPITKGIWLNKNILKDPKSFDAYLQKSRAAYDAVKRAVEEGKIKDPAKLATAERYIKAGRELVDDSIYGCIVHELGHHIQWQMPSALVNSLGEGRAIRSVGISGYSGSGSIGEYIAESFVSWVHGELRCDYRIQEYFDSLSKQIPLNKKGENADYGYWEQIKTNSGAVRVHSRHGAQERDQNESIAKYMAEKHGHEIDLIPLAKQGKNPDSFDKTVGRFVEYKIPAENSYAAFDNCLRNGGEQANNIIILIRKDAPLGLLANALNARIQWRNNIETIRIVRGGKDAFFTKNQVAAKGFKIEEADFE